MSDKSKSKMQNKTSAITSRRDRSKNSSRTSTSNTFINSKYTVIPGFQKGQRHTTCPKEFQAVMLMKQTMSYRKKICVLKGGILKVYTRPKDVESGKVAYIIDLGTSIVSHQERVHLSINADDQIYRFKVQEINLFRNWISHLKRHRLYRLDQLLFPSPAAIAKPIEQVKQEEVHETVPEKAVGISAEQLDEFVHKPVTDHDDAMRQLIAMYLATGKKMEKLDKTRAAANKGQSLSKPEVMVRNEHYRIAQEVQYLTGQMLHKMQEERQKHFNQLKDIKSKEKDNVEGVLASLAEPKSPIANIESYPKVKEAPYQKDRQSPVVEHEQHPKFIHVPKPETKIETQPKAEIEKLSKSSSVTSSTNGEIEDDDEEDSSSDSESKAIPDETAVSESIEAATTLSVTKSKTSSTTFRKHLPVPMVPCNVSMWSFLKIGKDMTKLSFPVEMFEPVGTLQVLCEELEYSELLDHAVKQQDVHMRMVLVACFAVSRYAATVYRGQRKPFNPLEGETYENKRDDLGWSFIGEQVSHHPPVTAVHARGQSWEFWQSALYNVAFWGKWVEAEQKTPVNLLLSTFRERYVWNKVVTSLHNLFSGIKYCDHHGKMTIKCSNGVMCKLTFKKLSSSSKHEFQGSVHDSSGKIKHVLFGKWSEAVYLGVPSNKQCIWTPIKFPSQNAQYYGLNSFAISLNELTPELRKSLPPTDSRFRPDQRLLEDGKVKEAQAKKTELEVRQRARCEQREYKAKWFKEEKKNEWKFTERYWESRKNQFNEINFDALW